MEAPVTVLGPTAISQLSPALGQNQRRAVSPRPNAAKAPTIQGQTGLSGSGAGKGAGGSAAATLGKGSGASVSAADGIG